MRTKKKELYLVDKYGKRAGVVLDIETYNKLGEKRWKRV